MLEEDGETFRHILTHHDDVQPFHPTGFPTPGEGLLGMVVAGGVPVRAVGAEALPLAVIPGNPLVGSFLGVPLATARRSYGVLVFIDKRGRAEFNCQDESLAVSLSAQLAVADESLQREAEMARSAARLERDAEQMAISRRIDRAVLSAHRPREVASAVVPHLHQLLGCWSVGVWVFDWDGQTAERLAAQGAAEPLLPPGTKVPLEALGARDIEDLAAGRDHIEEDVARLQEPAQMVRMLQSAGLRSYIRIPMASEGRVIGTLVLSSDRPGMVDSERLEIARQVADQLAIAIRHAMLFHQVRSGRECLRTLSRQLLKAQQEERRRIARELHDEIGQSLTTVKINLHRAMDVDAAGSASPHLRESLGLMDLVLQEVRHISLYLRPSVLDDLGLVASVQWQLDRMSRRASFVGSFIAEPPEIRLLPEIETECFRVVQEALTNVAQSCSGAAGGSHAVVELRAPGVGDSGRRSRIRRGSGAATRRAGASLGLLGMRERVALLGGRITIEAGPSRGSKVHLRIPLVTPGSSRAQPGEKEAS